MNWLALVQPILSVAMGAISSSGDRKELRRVVRQRILAPSFRDIKDPVKRRALAEEIVMTAYGVKANNPLQILVAWLCKKMMFEDKIKMVDEVFLADIADNVDSFKAREQRDASWEFTNGKEAIKKLVRDIFAAL